MIYFAQLPTGAIKIGYSHDVNLRLRELERHYGQSLDLLHTLEGDIADEREIHERFAHLRFGQTEQFKPGPELMEFIGKPLLVGINPDSVEALGYAANDVITRIDRMVAAKARYVSATRDIPLAEYLTELLRAIVDRDFERATKAKEE